MPFREWHPDASLGIPQCDAISGMASGCVVGNAPMRCHFGIGINLRGSVGVSDGLDGLEVGVSELAVLPKGSRPEKTRRNRLCDPALQTRRLFIWDYCALGGPAVNQGVRLACFWAAICPARGWLAVAPAETCVSSRCGAQPAFISRISGCLDPPRSGPRGADCHKALAEGLAML